jgi:hypothetical protein
LRNSYELDLGAALDAAWLRHARINADALLGLTHDRSQHTSILAKRGLRLHDPAAARSGDGALQAQLTDPQLTPCHAASTKPRSPRSVSTTKLARKRRASQSL